MPTIEAKQHGVVFAAPGQGIKKWEDGLDLLKIWPRTQGIYDRVLKSTGVNIVEVCESTEAITDPSIVQPAALGIGYARADFLCHEVIKADHLLSLSSGEFTVAAISNALSLEDAAMLAHHRGLYQQEVAGGKGGSVLVMHRRGPRQIRELERLARTIPGVNISNYHSPIKTGIAFTHEVYEEMKEGLDNIEGIRRVIDVKNLRFPPHGPAVDEAQQLLKQKFDGVRVNDASIEIVANLTGRLTRKARTVKKNLIWQTTSPTRLSRGIAYLIGKGVEEFYDLGPDDSMSKLLGDYVQLHDIQVHPPISSK